MAGIEHEILPLPVHCGVKSSGLSFANGFCDGFRTGTMVIAWMRRDQCRAGVVVVAVPHITQKRRFLIGTHFHERLRLRWSRDHHDLKVWSGSRIRSCAGGRSLQTAPEPEQTENAAMQCGRKGGGKRLGKVAVVTTMLDRSTIGFRCERIDRTGRSSHQAAG